MPDLDPLSRDLLIRTVIGEADDQPPAGQAAVAHVALNRLASGKWGNTMPDVLFAKNQWEPWSTRSNELISIPRDSPRYQRTAQIVDGVLGGNIADPTGGMTHFLEPNIVQQRYGRLPDWASGPGLRIGSHVFYAPEGRVMPQEDLISEWLPKGSGKSAAAAAAKATPAAEEDLVGEWASPQKAAPAKPTEAPTDVASARATIAGWESAGRTSSEGEDWINRGIREAHGHGDPNLTTLVTGQRPDSWGDEATRTGLGLVRGALDPGATLGQGIAYTSERATNFLQHLGVVSPETAQSVADWHTRVNQRISAENAGFEEAQPGLAGNLGRLGGQIAATAPILRAGSAALRALPGAPAIEAWAARHPVLAAWGGGATTGGTINALTSSSSDIPLPEQVGWGAALGGPLGVLGRGVGRFFSGGVDRETSDLARTAMDKYGIPLRADQISGNEMVKRAGALGAKLPGTGMASNIAEQQAALNRGVANTFGEDADKITKNVWGRAADRIGNVFDQTLPQLEAHLNPKVSARLQAVSDAADPSYLPADDARIVQRHISDIIQQFTGVSGKVGAPTTAKGAGRMDGKQIQAMIAKGSPLDRSISGGSSNVKYLASQLKDVLLDAVGQTPTGRAKTAAAYVQNLQAFQNARFQYKNLKTVEDLVEKSPTGDISPALLQGAVRNSFNNLARGGGGDLAELADIGQRFLKPPGTSGTAEHLALMKLGLTAAGGLGGIAAFDPEHFQRDAAILGLALGGARAGGGVLKARWPARLAVRSGQRTSPPQLSNVLSSTLPALAPRENPLALPAPRAPSIP